MAINGISRRSTRQAGAGVLALVLFLVAVPPTQAQRSAANEVSQPTLRSVDCNVNGIDDALEIAAGTADDCNGNDMPDECDVPPTHDCCEESGIGSCSSGAITACVCAQDSFCCTDLWDSLCVEEVETFGCGTCGGDSADCNANGVPDECEDCNRNGVGDECEIASGDAADCNANLIPDECEVVAVDQSYTPSWQGAWANIMTPGFNEQTFKPQSSLLFGVDVGITDDPPGTGSDTLTVRIFRGTVEIATASQLVAVPYEGFLHFPLPAVSVTPGETLSLFLEGGAGNVFGWQWNNIGDYSDGVALYNGSPFAAGGADWFFQTYGRSSSDCNADSLPDDCGYAGRLYWADDGNNLIERTDIDGTNIVTVTPTANVSIRGVAVDPAGKVYWTDLDNNKILRSDLDGANIEDVITVLDNPVGLALDLGAGKIYWAEAGAADRIARANLDGTSMQILATGLGTPTGIALDLTASKVYWAEQVGDQIQRANLDGTAVESLVSVNGPTEVALDVLGGKMYWTKYADGIVQRANLDGTGVETIASGQTNCAGIDLDTSAGKIYWSQANAGVIRRANLDGSNVEDVVTGLGITFRLDFVPGGMDCNADGILDDCQIAQNDCDHSGVFDACELAVTTSDQPNLPIPDNNATGRTVTMEVTEHGPVTDLDLALHITHPWQGDLNAWLSHDGVSVQIIRRAGGSQNGCGVTSFGYSADNFGTASNPLILDDDAGPIIGCYAGSFGSGIQNYAGPARPQNPLSAFNGMDRAGTWTLKVSDHFVGATGRIKAWSLRFGGAADCNANGSPDMCEVFGPGDYDANGTVDTADYPFFAECLSGPDQAPSVWLGECADTCLSVFDADADSDIDLRDYSEFTRSMQP